MNNPQRTKAEIPMTPRPATSATPKRIQRKRTKGWKVPQNTVYVGRPTKWGNPFKPSDFWDWNYQVSLQKALNAYQEHLLNDGLISQLRELTGKNLACWCPPNRPCHADVLLELANA